jgi:aspartyl-tRNA(Asn)/glutamyl-tRNA(Gln) amidotransferase subunit A
MDNLYSLTAGELLSLLDKKSVKPEEIIESVYSRAQSVDKKIKGYIHLDKEKALSQAKGLPVSGKLKGIPVAIKDNICVEGELTTCASKILRGFKPPYNATIIEKLKSEGAIIFGKTNMDEFAFGSSCENSSYFPTLNPWDTARIPGGSSGGSAAVVSADEAIMAIGSDTGGSIRQPASLCGVVGMKPTYGRVSRYGLIAFASSLDQIGPLAKNVSDAALLLGVIAGFDKKDSTSVNVPVPDYLSYLKNDVKGMKIGIPKEYFVAGMDKEVEAAIKEAIDLLKGKGAQIVEVISLLLPKRHLTSRVLTGCNTVTAARIPRTSWICTRGRAEKVSARRRSAGSSSAHMCYPAGITTPIISRRKKSERS